MRIKKEEKAAFFFALLFLCLSPFMCFFSVLFFKLF